MTDITHLVVNGCSWTYCQGLDDPKTQGWPALVAKELGVEVVNLAVPGCGNDSIHRRTYEYVYESLPTGSKPFFIIAWSQYWRRETWHNKFLGYKDYNDYSLVSLPNEGSLPETNMERALLDDWNELDFFRRTYLAKLSLMNLFKSHEIPYLMGDYSYEINEEAIIEELRSRFPVIIDTVLNNPRQINRFSQITAPYSRLPCGHDGLDAQEVLSSYIISEIDKQYGKLNTISGNYLTLKDFKLTNKIDSRDNKTVWR